LKLQYDETLSNFAFSFNLRRYAVASGAAVAAVGSDTGGSVRLPAAYTALVVGCGCPKP